VGIAHVGVRLVLRADWKSPWVHRPVPSKSSYAKTLRAGESSAIAIAASGPTSGRQRYILDTLEQLCKEVGLPGRKARQATRVLLGREFLPSVILPGKEEVMRWENRFGSSDGKMDAVSFYEKHWAIYADEGVLFQKQLRDLDTPLFEAIKWQCRVQKLNPDDYLPPPSRTREVPERKTGVVHKQTVDVVDDRPRIEAAAVAISLGDHARFGSSQKRTSDESSVPSRSRASRAVKGMAA
jgi:hypothetical protein